MSSFRYLKFPSFPIDEIEEWTYMGCPNIYTFVNMGKISHPCFDEKELEKYLPNNTCCDEPYLIKYESGGEFLRHKDLQINEDHIGAVLIYPPFGKFEGGELVVETSSGVLSLKNTSIDYLMVIVSITDYHEVKKILNGTRYVFLSPWFKKM